MEALYRGVEISLLGLSFALVLAVAAMPALRLTPNGEASLAVTLPMISVTAGE